MGNICRQGLVDDSLSYIWPRPEASSTDSVAHALEHVSELCDQQVASELKKKLALIPVPQAWVLLALGGATGSKGRQDT